MIGQRGSCRVLTRRLRTGIAVVTLTSVLGVPSLAQAAPLVWIGSPGYKDANTSSYVQWPTLAFSKPANHHIVWSGDWSVDLIAGKPTIGTSTPIYLYAAPQSSSTTIKAKVTKIAPVVCKDGGTAGDYVRIGLFSGTTGTKHVGSVWYAHIKPTQTMRDRFKDGKWISRWETLVGYPGSYPTAPTTCWDNLHLHMEFDTAGSAAPYSCYNREYVGGGQLFSSNFLGFIGGTTAQTSSVRRGKCP